MNRVTKSNNEGAVSIFVVVFAALLITVITIAFVRIMMRDQMNASINDLSTSALDSANAGVEDAKRILSAYHNNCIAIDNEDSNDCKGIKTALDSYACDSLQKVGLVQASADGDYIVQSNEGTNKDSELQQAYTCVKIHVNTDDYIGSLNLSSARLIPLEATDDFTKVKIEWFTASDLRSANGTNDGSIDLASDNKLLKQSDWPVNRPAILRVQLLQFGDSFTLSDFDSNEDDTSNNATLFWIPTSAGLGIASFSEDSRNSFAATILQEAKCESNISDATSGYACSATIGLPKPHGSDALNRHAYLRLSSIYSPQTTFKVTMLDKLDKPVSFKAVQPSVDSTGRANDYFRRVQTRLDLGGSTIPYSVEELNLTSDLCKAFTVSSKASGFKQGDCRL